MTRFAQGTNPEYVATINNAMYGDGKDNPQVQQELLEEASNIGPTGEGPLNDDGTPVIKVMDSLDCYCWSWFILCLLSRNV